MSSASYRLLKRGFDLGLAALALALLWPVLLVIAVVVGADSAGPALFRQVRVGQGGKPFVMLKFRTMVLGAATMSANVSPDDDPRVTRAGRVLRRSYLDELPQLWNILRGSMSFVGPRPETPEYVGLLTSAERQVLTVPVGLVGPSTLAFMDEATTLGTVPDPAAYYTTTMLHDRVAADLTYLEVRCFRYDVCLLARQAWAILRRL